MTTVDDMAAQYITILLVEDDPPTLWRLQDALVKAGFDVVPYPTDYQTTGKPEELWTLRTRPSRGITMVEDALHEWIGLVAYRMMGKSDSLFPGPGEADLSRQDERDSGRPLRGAHFRPRQLVATPPQPYRTWTYGPRLPRRANG